MSESFVKERKQALRSAAMAQRNALSGIQSRAWSGLIQGAVLGFPLYLRSRSVALYSPIRNEVETVAIREHALANGKAVYYPKLVGKTSLELARVDSASKFEPGPFGVLEPVDSQFLSENDERPLLIFVPGLVFDARGNRIGRGEGWYDRLLRKRPASAIALGLAYEFQAVTEIPVHDWDERMNYVITERRIIDCARSQSSLAS